MKKESGQTGTDPDKPRHSEGEKEGDTKRISENYLIESVQEGTEHAKTRLGEGRVI